MTQLLSFLTTLVSLIGLAVTLCLGLYIVTRTPRSRLSWLAALTLWAMSCFFLHNALAINAPASSILVLLRPAAILALPFGFHLTLLLPPGEEREARWFYQPALRLPRPIQDRAGSLALPLSRLVVPLAYALAIALAIGGSLPLGLPSQRLVDPPVYLSARVPGLFYPLAIIYLVVLICLTFLHLWLGQGQSSSQRYRRWYAPLFIAAGLTGLGGLYLSLGVWFELDIPSFPADFAVGAAAVILGTIVAQHNALAEGRDIKRDLLYVALVIGSFTVFYVIVAEFLYLGGHIFSTLTVILIIVVAVSSLMLYDGLRTTLDRLFYREQYRQLRANLRALAREAGIGQALPDRLQGLLSALCRTRRIRSGFIALQKGDVFVCEATEHACAVGQTFAENALSTAEITDLPRPDAENPGGMTLLVPIHSGDEQTGVLVLGPKEDGASYGEDDLMLLDDLSTRLATVIQNSWLQEERVDAINEMVADFRQREHILQRQVQEMLAAREDEVRPVLEGVGEKAFVSLVEDALRQLYDYSYLGEHSLARLQVVDLCLVNRYEEFVTHIDRGKALSETLTKALNKLRPESTEPKPQDIPSREWQPFVILHDAYILGELNRDIMSKLYISEGTFNRTRRRAVRSVAKALQEMEQEAQQRAK
jgi:hypothetical protein